MKHYLGIILSVIYALTLRGLAEFKIIEINSLSFLIITPMLLGFIPFFLKDKSFLKSIFKTILFPLISVLLFLLLAVITRLEDLACFMIIGFPYILFSIAVSLILRELFKDKDDGISKNAIPIFMLPILLGMIEKQLPKENADLSISNEIVINRDKQDVWNNLLAVPDLTDDGSKGFVNYLGIPRPIRSTYDALNNVRLGYFENNIVLNESVVQLIELEKLVFKINLDKSQLASSPTLAHVLNNHTIEFDTIKYELSSIGERQTKLKLSTKFTINSNISFYAQYWSNLIINDFETSLLKALKRAIEAK
ncbi:MAG: hypothetical protein ACI837_002195 [Crocinitomicaceae bacterium]|jgi:hypothetical protein